MYILEIGLFETAKKKVRRLEDHSGTDFRTITTAKINRQKRMLNVARFASTGPKATATPFGSVSEPSYANWVAAATKKPESTVQTRSAPNNTACRKDNADGHQRTPSAARLTKELVARSHTV